MGGGECCGVLFLGRNAFGVRTESSSASYIATVSAGPEKKCERGSRLQSWRGHGRHDPIAHGMRPATVQTSGYGELGRAVRTDGLGLEGIERLATLSAAPKISQRGCCSAPGTGKTIPARQFCQAQQSSGLLQASPTIHQNEY